MKKKRLLVFIKKFRISFLPIIVLRFLFSLSAGIRGKLFIAVRYILLNSIIDHCGYNVKIGHGCLLSYISNLEVGNNVSINEYCSIGCRGGVIIGSNVSIAHRSTILSTTHIIGGKSTVTKRNGIELKRTQIDDDVWIGAGVVVIGGVKIGQGVVVGANSVVTCDLEPYGVYAGSPAKLIRFRE